MIEIKNDSEAEIKKSNKIIGIEFEKGNKYLLWKRKELPKKSKRYSFFSIIKDIDENVDEKFHMIDYVLDTSVSEEKEYSKPIEEVKVDLLAFNGKSYDVYLLTQEEAKPFLKMVLVMSLTDEPIKRSI